eukprot:2054704-Rhodomonas_salina.1
MLQLHRTLGLLGRGDNYLMGLIPFEGKHLPPLTGRVEAHLVAIQHLPGTYVTYPTRGRGREG